MSKENATDFARTAADTQNPGMVRELLYFLRQNKKWWLLPILLGLVVMGALLFLAATPLAPFIYPLF